jgi:hypothetical protein
MLSVKSNFIRVPKTDQKDMGTTLAEKLKNRDKENVGLGKLVTDLSPDLAIIHELRF